MATVDAPRDGNDVPAALFLISGSTRQVAPGQINQATGRILMDTASGSGTVTSVSVVTANGFAGSVATATTTPAITLSTTITGLLKGNGTAISAAVSNTDFQAPIALTTTGTSGAATFNGTTLNIPNYATGGSGTVNSGTAGQLTYYAGTGTAVSGNANATISAGALTLGVATSVLGQLILSGSTSGTTTLTPNVIASGTLTLPAATDTLIGKATTDTLTNKTYDTAGTGNAFSINGVAVTANTGTGAVARATSPVFVTPTLGAASATTLNGNTFTTGTYTLTGTAGKTLTFQNSITLTGTDATTMTFPTTSKTLAANDASNWTLGSQAIGDLLTASSTTAYTRLAAVAVGSVLVSAGTGTQPVWSAGPQVTTIELGSATDTTIARVSAGVVSIEGVTIATSSNTLTLSAKRITRRLTTVNAPGATPSTNTDNMDIANFTGLNAAITSMTTNLTGTPVDGDMIEFRFLDDGTARAITWGATFAATTVALPTTTVISTCLRALFEWRAASSKWECVAVA